MASFDVFLSFCGKDTRKAFVSHLYAELDRMSINVFKDDEKLERGEFINRELIEAIRKSRFAVVIISQNYAFSSWCLQELEEIIDCFRKGSLTAIFPIFYEVDPSDVRHQRGIFGEAFRKHETQNLENVKRWMQALTTVASISGEHTSNWMEYSKLIEKVSSNILGRLNSALSSDWSRLVGMDTHMENIWPLLCQGSNNEVRVIGICGMGGIGKTTIAKYIYGTLSSEFQASCFMENVGQMYKRYGQTHVQEKLLSQIFRRRDLMLPCTTDASQVIKARLIHLKVLIVLDGVDERQQLDTLVENADAFGQGSRIIITSRDSALLSPWPAYEVEYLNEDDAIQLFNLSAFGKRYPEEGFSDLSAHAAKYAGGVPLALKVWGSYLKEMSKDEWETAQFELERRLDRKIMNVLRVSYDGLDEQAKDIFLYIACFFKGENIDRITRLLDAKYSNTDFWIRAVLAKKCLVDVSSTGIVSVHNLLQEMAREIVVQQSIDQPERRKFLLNSSDVYDVLTDATGTETIEAISLNVSEIKGLTFTDQAFKRMHNLMFLDAHGHHAKSTMVQAIELSSLPRKLISLCWDGLPLRTLPSKYRPECLVELCLRYSELERLWEIAPPLEKLKKIDLHGSKNLTTLPDLLAAPYLEELDLTECLSLEALTELPTSLRHLALSGTAIEELPSSIGNLLHLACLNLRDCKRLKTLPSEIGNLTRLEELYLGGCESLISSSNMNVIYLGMPLFPSLRSMISLTNLSLNSCHGIQVFLEVPTSLRSLDLSYTAIEEVPSSAGSLLHLVRLSMRNCRSLSSIHSDIGNLSELQELDLGGCDVLISIPNTIEKMESLKRLILNDCKKLRRLPRLPQSLEDFMALECLSLEKITRSSSLPFELHHSHCFNLPGNPDGQHLASLSQKRARKPLFASLPGCQIPGHFRYQATGSSLTIFIPPTHLLVGFVGSMVVATNGGYHYLSSYKFQCLLTLEDETKNFLQRYSLPSYDIGYAGYSRRDSLHHQRCLMESRPLKTDTLFLCSWWFEKPEKYTNMAIEFSLEGSDSHSFQIKECGVRPVYTEEPGESAEIDAERQTHSTSFTSQYPGDSRQSLNATAGPTKRGRYEVFPRRGSLFFTPSVRESLSKKEGSRGQKSVSPLSVLRPSAFDTFFRKRL